MELTILKKYKFKLKVHWKLSTLLFLQSQYEDQELPFKDIILAVTL